MSSKNKLLAWITVTLLLSLLAVAEDTTSYIKFNMSSIRAKSPLTNSYFLLKMYYCLATIRSVCLKEKEEPIRTDSSPAYMTTAIASTGLKALGNGSSRQ